MNMSARVVAPIAPLHSDPRTSSPQASQVLYGHHIDVLEVTAEWQRVRGADGYEGWIHRGYLAPARGDAVGIAGGDTLSLGATIRDATRRVLHLPLGALPAPGDTLVDGEVVASAERWRRFPRSVAAAAATAETFFSGTSYQWGGVTPWGADCSGLVQTACAVHGVALPRDAWQQASVGDDVTNAPEELLAGDLLFFSERSDDRITHVGIALGGGRMVHSALGRGGFCVERLGDKRDPYVVALRQRFRSARRISRAGGPN
ncbi:MAG: hypothetical protein NVS1B4_00440 [Gemmatimonadaceae bacterium]